MPQKRDNLLSDLSYQQQIRNATIIKLVIHQMNALYNKTDFLNSLFCTKLQGIISRVLNSYIQNSKTERFSFSDNYNNYAVSQINIEDFFNNSEPMDLIFPDDIPLFLDYCNERKQGADCVSSILRLKMTDGSFQWTRITASFSYDSNGKPYYIIGTLMNVEEQVKITAQLHNVADERDSLLVTVPGGIGIYEFTDCFRTLYINDETARIIGFEKDELMNIIQNDATARFHPDDISPLIQKANETIANGKELFTFDYRLLNKMGNYQWVGVRCRITVQNDQALFYTIMIDKTAEKEAERIAADKKNKSGAGFSESASNYR